MAELVDAMASGAIRVLSVQVRILLFVKKKKFYKKQSVTQLVACLLWEQDVVGSNPTSLNNGNLAGDFKKNYEYYGTG